MLIGNIIFRKIANSLPGLESKLRQAGMQDKPEEFVKRTFISAFYMTTGLIFFLGAILAKLKVMFGVVYFIFPVLFIILFFYFLKLPDVKIGRKEKEISREILFVTRHLIIELESGVTLYDAMVNINKNYPTIGKYFREITNKVDMGTPLEDAINEAIELTPSANFRKILWQIINSLTTGADVNKSLGAVVDQIAREQIIEMQTYAKKLNPLAMFYMILAVIVPTLGTTMLIVFASFLSIELNLTTLIIGAILLGFFQLIFLGFVRGSRPAVEL
ncbi:MAG: type II secretion system F family protein [Candidatus Woesearchaeota archaeon]